MSSFDKFKTYISDWCGGGNVFAVPVNMKQCCLAPESLPALPVILFA
jgi:hypothetical protein